MQKHQTIDPQGRFVSEFIRPAAAYSISAKLTAPQLYIPVEAPLGAVVDAAVPN